MSPDPDQSHRPVFVRWMESYSVSDDTIDAEHRRLLDIINDLYAEKATGRGSDALAGILDQLEEYTRSHFAHEEDVLRECSYPQYDDHKRLHDEMVSRTRVIRAQYRAGQTGLPDDLLLFLRDWWVNHITRLDKQYATYLS